MQNFTQNAFYVALAAVFAQLNTFNNLLLQQAVRTFSTLAQTGNANVDALIDELNAAFEEDVQLTSKERAGTALARNALHEAVECLEHDDTLAALNALAQAIVQRQYAMEQLFA